jgi:putative DNA primase/helicase
MSNLLPKNRDEIKNKLADLGYEWPEDGDLTSSILQKVATARPSREFLMVGAPGWYEPAFVIPGKVFASGNNKPEIYIDPNSDAHVGAFVLGEGSLKDWQELVAKPSRQSSRLRLSIAAALAAPFLRRLGLDSFGINWFSETSDGKTTSLVVAASVPGLLGPEGLPGWADSEPALEALLRGCRDCPMALDDTGDGEHQMRLDKKARRLAFLIARNRPRKLSKVYERNNGLEPRETRNIVLSSSERALGQIARAAGKGRLGGEEVRLIDIPASDPTSSGIIDGYIAPAAGKTLRETTKEFVETLKANAIKHQGYAYWELLEKFVNDPHGLDRLKIYKKRFERDAVLPDRHNAR